MIHPKHDALRSVGLVPVNLLLSLSFGPPNSLIEVDRI